MVSLVLTILASFYPNTFTVFTAVFNEVSVSYNLGATLGFWILLAPLYWKYLPEELKIYMALDMKGKIFILLLIFRLFPKKRHLKYLTLS